MKRRFPVPWGLLIVLGLYGLGVLGYVWSQYWNSPQYKAAQLYANALGLLGVDDGRRCSEAELNRAFELTMQAAVLVPEEMMLVEHLESLRHRFEERHFALRPEWVHSVEMMSLSARRIAEAQKATLVIGVRDRGWHADQLLAGPRTVLLWSLPGAVLIILFWAYTQFSAARVRAQEHEAGLKSQEREVESLGDFRRRPEPKPSSTLDEDDESTQVEQPKPRPAMKSVTTTGRPYVRRKPR